MDESSSIRSWIFVHLSQLVCSHTPAHAWRMCNHFITKPQNAYGILLLYDKWLGVWYDYSCSAPLSCKPSLHSARVKYTYLWNPPILSYWSHLCKQIIWTFKWIINWHFLHTIQIFYMLSSLLRTALLRVRRTHLTRYYSVCKKILPKYRGTAPPLVHLSTLNYQESCLS